MSVTPALFESSGLLNGRNADERYTPRWIFQQLGIRFTLDVAAPIGGAPWVPADTHYSRDHDGLHQPWRGRVWMNPPYGNVGPWVDRFLDHRDGICLVPFVKSVWLDDLWAGADGIAKVPERGDGIWFNRPDDGTGRRGRNRAIRLQYPVMLAACSAECVEAIARVGPALMRHATGP